MANELRPTERRLTYFYRKGVAQSGCSAIAIELEAIRRDLSEFNRYYDRFVESRDEDDLVLAGQLIQDVAGGCKKALDEVQKSVKKISNRQKMLRDGPSLNLDLNGAGNITALDLSVGDLRVDINGAGTLHVGGTASDVRVDINGAGDFDGEELATESANIEINGLGDASIQVSERLNAEINGAGSISYNGDPDVRSDVNGLGSVRRAGD